METKNTPLLFQQELNTFYKDILNCEITHPPYWAGRVPETFFLRRRKGIDIYHDWGGDEVLDYTKFEGEEYAIVRHNNDIKVKKWLNEVDTSDLTKIVNTDRVLNPGWGKHDDFTISGTFTIQDFSLQSDGHKLYIFNTATCTIDGVSSKQCLVTEYKLKLQDNVSSYQVEAGNTYIIKALSSYIGSSSNIKAEISSGGKSLFVYLQSTCKFYQIELQTPFDMSSLSDTITGYSQLTVTDTYALKVQDMYISPDVTKIFWVGDEQYRIAGNHIYYGTFSYNDITTLSSHSEKLLYKDDGQEFGSGTEFIGLTMPLDGKKMYISVASSGQLQKLVYQYDLTSSFNISTIDEEASYVVDLGQKGLTGGVYNLATTSDGNNLYINNSNNKIIQLWFEHAKTLITQTEYTELSGKINYSFKRGFQSAKGEKLYGGTITETEDPETHRIVRSITDKITGTAEQGTLKLTPTTAPSPAWTENQYVGKYCYLFGGATGPGDGTSQGCVFPITGTKSTYLITSQGWDVPPKDTTYAIFDGYGEILTFIGVDGLYAIHNDDFIWRYESMSNGTPTAPEGVVDADWSNGMMYAILTNGGVVMSATKTNDGSNSLGGGYMAGYMNNSSLIGNISGALRIVPFNDIVVIFTNNGIYVIKKESMDVMGTTINTYTLDLAFGFLGLHSFKSVCSYNTGIYFLSNKKTLLSLNIEESYYNKYKITTEDLGIDIQQWLDNIHDVDPVSIAINTETIFVTRYDTVKNNSTIFQYSNYYSFRHRWETLLAIKDLTVDTDETYLGVVAYRYNLTDRKYDEFEQDFEQHLRWFHGDTDIFSLKTILYHQLYLGVNTDLNSQVYYKARLSTGLYEYNIPLSNALFLQKSSNLTAEKVLGNSIVGYQTLGGNAEKYVIGTYLSDVDILEIPLGLTYSLLEIIISGDFEIGGNILGALVHDPHLTPYEDVVAYLNE